MTTISLSDQERDVLAHLTAQAILTPEARRAQALLWLADGTSPQTVAARLRISRQTVYNWTTSFIERRSECNIEIRLADKKRSGRPRKNIAPLRASLPQIIDPLIASVLGRDPREFGYRSVVWTARFLRQYLQDEHTLTVTVKHVNGSLARLEACWTPESPYEGRFPPHMATG